MISDKKILTHFVSSFMYRDCGFLFFVYLLYLKSINSRHSLFEYLNMLHIKIKYYSSCCFTIFHLYSETYSKKNDIQEK